MTVDELILKLVQSRGGAGVKVEIDHDGAWFPVTRVYYDEEMNTIRIASYRT